MGMDVDLVEDVDIGAVDLRAQGQLVGQGQGYAVADIGPDDQRERRLGAILHRRLVLVKYENLTVGVDRRRNLVPVGIYPAVRLLDGDGDGGDVVGANRSPRRAKAVWSGGTASRAEPWRSAMAVGRERRPLAKVRLQQRPGVSAVAWVEHDLRSLPRVGRGVV